jgi:hypothetical protein
MLCFLFFFLNPIAGGVRSPRGVDTDSLEGSGQVQRGSDSQVIPLGFLELQKAAFSADGRGYFQGKVGELVGQFVPGRTNQEFSLARFKISCCAADAIELKALIRSEKPLNISEFQGHWVKVVGLIGFSKRRDRNEYITVITLVEDDDEALKGTNLKPIQIVPPDTNPYLY